MKEVDHTLNDLRLHYKKMSRGFGVALTRKEIDHRMKVQEERNPLRTRRDEYGFPVVPVKRRGW